MIYDFQGALGSRDFLISWFEGVLAVRGKPGQELEGPGQLKLPGEPPHSSA